MANETSTSIYKGHPIISLPTGDHSEFKFGQRKALAVIQHLDAVLAFAEAAPLPANTPARIEDFKGHAILVLPMSDDETFQFGQRKAQAILEHLDAVKTFAEAAAAPPAPAATTAPAAAPQPAASEPEPQHMRRAAAFRKLAEGMANRLAELRRPAFEGLRPTARRERFRASKAEDARAAELVQDKLFALAEAWEQNTVPYALQGVTTKAQVEHLLRYPQYPYPVAAEDSLKKLLERTAGRRGAAHLNAEVGRLYRSRQRGEWLVKLYSYEETQAIEDLLKLAPNSDDLKRQLRPNYAEFRSFYPAHITNRLEYEEARQQLLALGNPDAGQKTQADHIADAERELVGLKIPGFFPTPAPIVQRLLALADIRAGHTVLEPSAGKGSIADGIRAAHPDVRVEVCEIQFRLREILKLKGYTLIGTDCLEMTPADRYDRILMNPPFESFQDIEHVRHAYTLLKPGGRLVAIMGAGVFFRTDKIAVSFRAWLADLGGYEEPLPEGAFKESGTGVRAHLVVIDKPEPEPQAATTALQPDSEPVNPTPLPEAQPEPQAATTALQPDSEPVTPTPVTYVQLALF